MVESEVDEYKLNSDDRQQSLRISIIDNEVISMVLTNKVTHERYIAQFGLPQLQEVCAVFNSTETILDALNILKNTIEAGKIELTEDLKEKTIEVKYNISLPSGEESPFNVNLLLEEGGETQVNDDGNANGVGGGEDDVQVLPPTFDYGGDKEAEEKYKNTTKDTTEYVKPIVESNVKPPILTLEYIEPILQVHYPDGTTKSTALPPRIQGVGGETPNISEEQFKSIQEQMNKNSTIKNFSPLKDFLNSNRSNSVVKKNVSAYSTQSTPYLGNNNVTRQNPFNNVVRSAMQSDQPQFNQTQTTFQMTNNIRTAFNNNINDANLNYNRATSGYSTMTMQQKPFNYDINNANFQQNNLNNTGYIQNSNLLNQNKNANFGGMVERRARITNNNANGPNNNSRDVNRSMSTPSHENFGKFNPKKNPDIYQPNPTNNPFQTNQGQFNNQRYPFDRNTQRPKMNNNPNAGPMNNIPMSSSQTVNIRQITQQSMNASQQVKSNMPQNNLSRIQQQQQRLQEVQRKIAQIQEQQKRLVEQRQLNQRKSNQINQGYAQANMMTQNQQQLRQQIQIVPQQSMGQNQMLNSQQIGQSQQYRQTQGFNSTQPITMHQQIRQTNSLTNNNPPLMQKNSFEIKQTRTQFLPPTGQNPKFKSKISSPIPSQTPSLTQNNISQQLLSLAQMASRQNEANPNYKQLQTYTLEQQNQTLGNTEQEEDIQEYQPQEEQQQQEYEQQYQEQETPVAASASNPDIEALFFTEDGRVIFRNGLLRGIIHKYAEIDEVVSTIQDKLLKGVKFNLVYKAFDDGDKAKIFHEKCDKLNMSLVLIETDKDVRFGGFTTKSWEGNCLKKIDNNAFVFSLETNLIYPIMKSEPAIGCYPKFGPVFFGCQIRIYDDFFTKGGTTCHKGLNYKTTKDYELNNGEQKYLIKDIEIYSIETIDI